jgi:Domain of unknown function (DUF4160)
MPEISRFLGIVIFMYASEHNPPHVHVRYNEFTAVFSLRTLNIMDGKMPARVRGLWKSGWNYIRMNCFPCGKARIFTA